MRSARLNCGFLSAGAREQRHLHLGDVLAFGAERQMSLVIHLARLELLVAPE